MLKRLAFLAGFVCGLLGLVACSPGPRPEKVVYQTVNVKVPVSCVPAAVGTAPAGLETRESLAAIPEGPKRYARMTADWFARVARMDITEAVVAGCKRVAPPP